MRIYVLGAGGGRYMLATQKLHTSGIWVEHNNTHIFIDPGNGALRDALDMHLPFDKLSYVFVSHQHLDHYDDVEAVVEAAYFYSRKKQITLMVNSCMAGKGENCIDAISPYHKSLVKKYLVFEKGKHYKDACCSFTFTPTLHHEPYALGMVVDFGNTILGYTSDTEYFDEFKKYFEKVDVLIAHFAILEKESRGFRHADKKDAFKMLSETKAKFVIFRHFAPPLLNYGLERLQHEFSEAFPDKRIIFAQDKGVYRIDKV